MATEKNHPAFDRPKIEAIDHKNPPKPQPAGKPTEHKHHAFACKPPEAIDHKNPPKPKEAVPSAPAPAGAK